MCDPVQQMAAIAESTIAKEESWIKQLQAAVERRTRIIQRMEFKQHRDRTALTLLMIRKEKAEAAQ